MSPVSACLRDICGVEPIVLNVRPDHSVDGVAIKVSGDESELEIVLDPSSSIDLALALCGAVSRLRPTQED